MTKPTLEQRFWSKVDTSAGPDGCWLWTGCVNKKPGGYGQLWVHGRMRRAHRISFELATGEQLGAIELDHICHSRACVNPAHLRPVTSKQNSENLSGANRNSTSGIRGVYEHKGRWLAQVRHNREQIHVGSFSTAAEADAAARAKRLELFTHNDADRIGGDSYVAT